MSLKIPLLFLKGTLTVSLLIQVLLHHNNGILMVNDINLEKNNLY